MPKMLGSSVKNRSNSEVFDLRRDPAQKEHGLDFLRKPIESSHHPAEDIHIDRRNALKKFVSIVVGAGAIGIATTSFCGFLGKLDVQSPTTTSSSPSSVSARDTTAMPSQYGLIDEDTASLNTIKVVYFGMATETTGTKQEYFTLPSPVFLSDVVSQIKQRHTILAPMLPTMQIVIDGNPSQGNPKLANYDEVDFIPVFSGG